MIKRDLHIFQIFVILIVAVTAIWFGIKGIK